MKYNHNTLFAVLFLLSLASCQKFDAGGSVKDGGFNILNTWKMDAYLRDNLSVDSILLFSEYQETYFEDSTIIIQYKDTSGFLHIDTGMWFWTNNNRFIHYQDLDSIKPFISNNNSGLRKYAGRPSVLLEDIKIRKLTLNEFQYIFYQEHLTHQFFLTAE